MIEPAYIKTQFEANNREADAKLEEYDLIRAKVTKVVSKAMAEAESPEVVAKVVVKAAQALRPKIRYTAGSLAGKLNFILRFAPAKIWIRSCATAFSLMRESHHDIFATGRVRHRRAA